MPKYHIKATLEEYCIVEANDPQHAFDMVLDGLIDYSNKNYDGMSIVKVEETTNA